MTKTDATVILLSRSEDYPWADNEIDDVFAAIYEREPDDDDGDAGERLSMAYAGI